MRSAFVEQKSRLGNRIKGPLLPYGESKKLALKSECYVRVILSLRYLVVVLNNPLEGLN